MHLSSDCNTHRKPFVNFPDLQIPFCDTCHSPTASQCLIIRVLDNTTISHLFVDEEDQGEGDGSPQPAVHHDELVDHLELVQAVLVGDEDEQEDAEDPEDGEGIILSSYGVLRLLG